MVIETCFGLYIMFNRMSSRGQTVKYMGGGGPHPHFAAHSTKSACAAAVKCGIMWQNVFYSLK